MLSITHESGEAFSRRTGRRVFVGIEAPHGIAYQEDGVLTWDNHSLWAARIATTRLPDPRLNRRMGAISGDPANQPTDSIPRATGDRGRAKAAYRFLDNRRVAQADLTAGAARDTARLAQGRPVVPAVRGTASPDLTAGRGRPDSGPISRRAVLWIGRLGGHSNRQGDGMPGVRTSWRGLRDSGLLIEGYRVARRRLE